MAIDCTYCEEKINAKRGIYIKCTACQDINLCLECFSAGAILADHQNDHPYELVDCGSFSIIDETWKAYEELALLEAVELFGVGSWTDIARAVETRSAEECQNRYLSVYVDNFFGRRTWNAVDRDQYVVNDHTCPDNRPLSPSLYLPEEDKIVDITREQQLRLGYMPKRDDFEREYDNDAEFLVSKLAVNANDDTELDQELKIAHINMYTDRLRERFRRKRVVLEYNLINLFFHMHPEENCNQQTDTSLQYNQISHPHTSGYFPSSHDHLESSGNKSMNPAESSSKVIPSASSTNTKPVPHNNSILRYFSKVTTPSKNIDPAANNQTTIHREKQDYSILSSYFSDLNKSMAEKDFNTMEKKLRTFCQFTSAENHNQLIRNLACEKELKLRIKDLIKRRKRGLRSTTSSQSINQESKSNIIQDSGFQQHKKSPSKQNEIEDRNVKLSIDKSTPTKVIQKKNIKIESAQAISSDSPDNELTSLRLLSDREKRLCKKLNLKPAQYINFKAYLLKENDKKKKKGAAQRLFTGDIDKTTKRRIQDFLARNNWIKV